MAFATTDTLVVVDVCLAFPVINDGILGTVCVAGACNATAAQVRYLVVDFYARRAGLVHNVQHSPVLQVNSLALHHTLCVAAQWIHLAYLVLHSEAEHSHCLVFYNSTLLVYAAPAFRLLVTGVHLVRQLVNVLEQVAVLPHRNQLLQKFLTYKHICYNLWHVL